MPGILGILGGDPDGRNRDMLQTMVKCMSYEPFYTAGTYVNEVLGMWLGWVCHKDSYSDCLPIWNGARDICLLFIGEHYAETRRAAASLASGPDSASELLQLYETMGPAFVRALNGPFNGILVDLRRRDALLFNDRYGLIRLYFHQEDQNFFFATEAKALLKVLPQTRVLQRDSLGEYLSLGCVLQNRSLFKGISLLPPASAWRFSRGSHIRPGSYFDPKAWEEQKRSGEAEYYEQLRDVWARILPRYLAGGRKVGVSMTGGLDSRMILGWAHQEAGTLPCYTFGGPYRECADVRLARQVAALCHQPHQVLSVGREFLSNYSTLAEKDIFVSDGAMDVTGSVDVYAQGLARAVAPVRLSGVNGGELLRGLIAFKPQPLRSEVYSRDTVRQAEVAAETYRRERVGNNLSFVAFKQAPWYMSTKFAIEHSQITFRTPYFDNELVKLAYTMPANLEGSTSPALRLIAEGNPALESIGTDRGLAFRAVPGLMHARHMFQQFTFKAEYAYDYGMPQWLARADHLLSPLRLESLFLGRHKFHHFRSYYRDSLAGYIKEILLDSRSRGRDHVDGKFLETMITGHVGGYRNYTIEIHKLLSVELIYRLFLD